MHHVRNLSRAAAAGAALLMCVSLTACGSSDDKSGSVTNSSPGATATDATSETPATSAAAAPAAKLNAEGLMAGNAKPADFPTGKAGEVSVVYTGPVVSDTVGGSRVVVVIRNNTDSGIAHVDISAAARDKAGKLVTTGTSQSTSPAQLEPGAVALSYIYFDSDAKQPPKGATFDYSFETTKADTASYNTVSLTTKEAERSGGSIVGTAVNEAKATATGPYAVNVYCFDTKGHPVSVGAQDYANEDGDVAPGTKVSYKADLFGASCKSYLVGVTGYFA